MKKFPQFLIIGAGKSGTTTLNTYLNRHPKIFMGFKEPNFFAYELTDRSLLSKEEQKHFDESITNLEDYLALFNEAGPDQITGEVSNSYLQRPHAYQRILHHCPDVKMIAMFRNPSERLLSRYGHLKRDGHLGAAENIESIFDKTSIWWNRPDFIPEGFYAKGLKPYFENFKREQFKFFLFEDFTNNPQQVVDEICEFLGIEPGFKVPEGLILNKSGTPKSKIVNAIFGQYSPVVRASQKILGPIHGWIKSNEKVQDWFYSMRSKNLKSEGYDPAMLKRIHNEIYCADVEELERMIDRDLSAWK